jgi:hypothetical protein
MTRELMKESLKRMLQESRKKTVDRRDPDGKLYSEVGTRSQISAENHYKKGMEHLEKGDHKQAAAHFRAAHDHMKVSEAIASGLDPEVVAELHADAKITSKVAGDPRS